ncbi:AEC family transporter [Streptomyces sp. SID7909]|uniref:AEC family transporter n=1 Tax=Streptomyces sp. SID7909 TaxID=2706092 RepID=UPI0013BA2CE2|nr:AEC family transporter [Streptomyces sp. SID7909]NEC09294.1 AEC family transporter [Streptomyces sp. SID7909]
MAAMHALLSAFAPIWVLTGIGYAVGRGGLLGEQAEAVLGRFVFHVAMPAALFTMVSGASPDVFGHPSMVAFAASTAVAAGAGFFLVRRVFGRGRADAAIGAMSSGHVNSANLGIPVAVQVLGDASFVAQVILFQVLVLSPVVLTLVESGTEGSDGADGRRPGGGVRRLLTMPLRNPIILASLLGVAVSATGLRLPAAVTHPCDVLGAAAVPTALITLGLSLHRGPGGGGRARRERAETAVVVAVKTLGQPLAALLVAGPLLHLPDHQLLAVVLCAALPTAQNSFIYAREYGLDTGLARDAIVVSTLVSMVTLSVAAWALGP